MCEGDFYYGDSSNKETPKKNGLGGDKLERKNFQNEGKVWVLGRGEAKYLEIWWRTY